MNLVQFLKKVDDTMSHMSDEQLKSCMRELARTLPEDKRQYFLGIMDAAQQRKITSVNHLREYYDDIHSEIETIKDVLMNINDGCRCLDSEYNEE